MRILEINYDYNYAMRGWTNETEEREEDWLERNIEYMQTNEDYKNFRIVRDLGEKNTEWLETWLKIGLENIWIRYANDPPLTIESFSECKSIDYLLQRFEHGNWCLGSAFYYKDLCFINQVEGGDEWLVIRKNIPFESYSCGYIIETDGRQELIDDIERMMNATDEQLRKLEY